jgi:hypothetical protein
MDMFKRNKKVTDYEEPHKHEEVLIFVCFIGSGLAGYFLTQGVNLLHYLHV